MKTRAKLEKEIIDISMKIHREFPELCKYIAEMPENITEQNNAHLDTKNFIEYYNSLDGMLSEYSRTHAVKRVKSNSETTKLGSYPLYPPSEDIYNQDKEERDLNPEDLSKKKTPNEKEGTLNEKDFKDDMSGDDLDVPGSELDDQQERVGSEDEENNYYSLGGDAHNDLDESS